MFRPWSRGYSGKICILLHALPILPNSTQSALDNAGWSQFGLQEGRERGSGKSIDEYVAGRRCVAAKRIELGQRLAKIPRRRTRLLHPQPEIAVGDVDAGPQQDPLASALRRRRPHRLQDLLRFPEISGVVERNSVAQRRMPRRNEILKPR